MHLNEKWHVQHDDEVWCESNYCVANCADEETAKHIAETHNLMLSAEDEWRDAMPNSYRSAKWGKYAAIYPSTVAQAIRIAGQRAPELNDVIVALVFFRIMADQRAHFLFENEKEKREALEREMAGLADPNAVHINMLRGSIALPSFEQIKHIYAGEFRALEDRENLRVEALAEIKATVDGDSDQPVEKIIYGHLDELARLDKGESYATISAGTYGQSNAGRPGDAEVSGEVAE